MSLRLRDAPDVCDRYPQTLQDGRLEDAYRRFEVLVRDPQFVWRELSVVEALREAEDGVVAPLADLLDDPSDLLGGRAHLRLAEVRLVHAPHPHPRSRSVIESISAAFSLWATGFAIRRAVQ